MPDLGERVRQLETKMDDVMYILKGNGKPGLVDDFRRHREEVLEFMRTWTQREDDKKIYDDRQERRAKEESALQEKRSRSIMGWVKFVALLVGTILAVLTFLGFSHEHKSDSLFQHSEVFDSAQIEQHFNAER